MYYIKIITKQDETRTPLISNKALNNFFNLFLEKRNDKYFLPLYYVNSEVEFYTQIMKKQDNRIYLNKNYLKFCFRGNILVYRRDSEKIYVECLNKYHNQFYLFENLLKINKTNNLLTKSL